MFDANELLIDGSSELTTSGSTPWKHMPTLGEATFQLIIPSSSGSAGLELTINGADDDDGSNEATLLTLINTGGSIGTGYGTTPDINGRKGTYTGTVVTNKPYKCAKYTVTGGSANFGKVILGLVTGGRYTEY